MVRNHYALHFRDALDVAQQVIPRLDELEKRTLEFARSVVHRQLPQPFGEAAPNCLSVLRSPTCFRLEEGTFCGFEGCSATAGCRHGLCTHVWNYEEATLALFPELHRSMLESHTRNMASHLTERTDFGSICRWARAAGGTPPLMGRRG